MGHYLLIVPLLLFSFTIHNSVGVLPRRPSSAETDKAFSELRISGSSRDGAGPSSAQRVGRVNILDDHTADDSFDVRRYSGSSSRSRIVTREFTLDGQIWPKRRYTIYMDIVPFEMDDEEHLVGPGEPDSLDTTREGAFDWQFSIKHNESDDDENIKVDVYMHIFGKLPHEKRHLYNKIKNANMARVHVWDLVENSIASSHPRHVKHELDRLSERDDELSRRKSRKRVSIDYKFNVQIWPRGVYELFLDVDEYQMDSRKRLGRHNGPPPFNTVTYDDGSYAWTFNVEMEESDKGPTHVYMHIFDLHGSHYEREIQVDRWDYHYIVDVVCNDLYEVPESGLEAQLRLLTNSIATGEKRKLKFLGQVWPFGKYKIYWDTNTFEMDEQQKVTKTEYVGMLPDDCESDGNGKFKLEYEIKDTSTEIGRWRLPPMNLCIFGKEVWMKQCMLVKDWKYVHVFDLKTGKRYDLPEHRVEAKLAELEREREREKEREREEAELEEERVENERKKRAEMREKNKNKFFF